MSAATFSLNSFTLNPECFSVDRYMGLPIVFVPSTRVYRTTDVNGISYFAETCNGLKAIMKGHGRRTLKRKAR